MSAAEKLSSIPLAADNLPDEPKTTVDALRSLLTGSATVAAPAAKPAPGKRPLRGKYNKKPKKTLMPLKSYRQSAAMSAQRLSPSSHNMLPDDDDDEMPVLTPELPLAVRQRSAQGRLPSANYVAKMVQTARKAQSARMAQSSRLVQGSRLGSSVAVSPATSHRSSASSHRGAGSPQSDAAARGGDAYKLSMHINYISGFSRPPEELVYREHTYSKPHNWQPEHEFMRPARYLFAEKPSSTRVSHKDTLSDDILDIETVDAEPCLPHNDAWRVGGWPGEEDPSPPSHEDQSRLSEDDDERAWDENISREGWSATQTRLFTAAVSSLEALELRRLVCAGSHAEFVTMQTAYALHANELRHQLVGCYNDYRLPVWLHLLLVAHLPREFKKHYAELLSRMRPAIPHIVDVMVKTPLPSVAVPGRLSGAGAAASTAPNIDLPPLDMDTVADQLIREKFKRLPNSPVFLVIPEDHRTYRKPRFVLFTSMLSQMGQTFTVQLTQAPDGATILQGLDHKMAEARGKLIELRGKLPGRQIVLVGFGVGAALASQLALMEPAFAVVCLGFPAATYAGRRGGADDAILSIRSPVMFVIGEHSHTATAAQIDTMRGRMVVYTQLVVLGMCDDNLVMPRQRMIDLKVTQPMVDKSILVEIHTFLGQLLTNPNPASFIKSKMSAVYKRMPKQSLSAGDDPTLKTTTRRYIKKQKTFQVSGNAPRKYVPRTTAAGSPSQASVPAVDQTNNDQQLALSKRKSRVSATQQLLINSAKYAAELPPDYAAQLQDAQAAPGIWQSKYKSPMLSPTKQLPSPQGAASGVPSTSPPPVTASSVFIAPSVPGGTNTVAMQSVKVISSSPSGIRITRKAPLPPPASSSSALVGSSLPSGRFSLTGRGDRGGTVTVLSPRPGAGPRTKLVMVGDAKGGQNVFGAARGQRGSPSAQTLTADNILNLPIIFAKDDDSMFHVGKTTDQTARMKASPTTNASQQETHKIVNKFEFSKPQPGVKYRKIFLTRMSQPVAEPMSGNKPGLKTITLQPNPVVESMPGPSGMLGRPRVPSPRLLGPVRHVAPGRPAGRMPGPGRPPGPGRGRPGRGGAVQRTVAAPQVVPMTDDLKFEVFLEDLEEDLGKRGVKQKGSSVVYHDSSPKKHCP